MLKRLFWFNNPKYKYIPIEQNKSVWDPMRPQILLTGWRGWRLVKLLFSDFASLLERHFYIPTKYIDTRMSKIIMAKVLQCYFILIEIICLLRCNKIIIRQSTFASLNFQQIGEKNVRISLFIFLFFSSGCMQPSRFLLDPSAWGVGGRVMRRRIHRFSSASPLRRKKIGTPNEWENSAPCQESAH